MNIEMWCTEFWINQVEWRRFAFVFHLRWRLWSNEILFFYRIFDNRGRIRDNLSLCFSLLLMTWKFSFSQRKKTAGGERKLHGSEPTLVCDHLISVDSLKSKIEDFRLAVLCRNEPWRRMNLTWNWIFSMCIVWLPNRSTIFSTIRCFSEIYWVECDELRSCWFHLNEIRFASKPKKTCRHVYHRSKWFFENLRRSSGFNRFPFKKNSSGISSSIVTNSMATRKCLDLHFQDNVDAINRMHRFVSVTD